MRLRSCLIVDDSPTVRMTLVAAIRRAKPSLEILEAEEETAAMKTFLDAQPDVVLLDMVLPGDKENAIENTEQEPTAGLGVLKKMLAERPGIPVVVVTGLPPNHPDVVEAVTLGAYSTLRKPVRPDDVKHLFDSLEPDANRFSYIQ